MSTTQPTLVPFVLTASGTGVAQDVTTADGKHSFAADTFPAFGGQDSAPSPLIYALAALTSCNQVTASVVARDLGVTLGAFEFHAQGDLDPAVLATGAQGNANFTTVTVRASVATDADDEQFARLVAETARRCPVTQLFARSGVELVNDWTRTELAG